MSPLAQFVAYFLLVSAIVAIVSSMVQEDRPRAIAAHAVQLYLWIVGGIASFSLVVYFLGWIFIRKP